MSELSDGADYKVLWQQMRGRAEAVEAAVAQERDECAKIADDALLDCITDEERDMATAIRSAILSRG